MTAAVHFEARLAERHFSGSFFFEENEARKRGEAALAEDEWLQFSKGMLHFTVSWTFFPPLSVLFHSLAQFEICTFLMICLLHFLHFFAKFHLSRNNGEKKKRKLKTEKNTRLRRWGRENLTVLPYPRIYFCGLNAVGKCCLGTSQRWECILSSPLVCCREKLNCWVFHSPTMLIFFDECLRLDRCASVQNLLISQNVSRDRS